MMPRRPLPALAALALAAALALFGNAPALAADPEVPMGCGASSSTKQAISSVSSTDKSITVVFKGNDGGASWHGTAGDLQICDSKGTSANLEGEGISNKNNPYGQTLTYTTFGAGDEASALTASTDYWVRWRGYGTGMPWLYIRTRAPPTLATLVSNTGRPNSSDANLGNDNAQAFTTGSNTDGYKLSRVEIYVTHKSGAVPTYTAEIWSANASGRPSTKLHTLTNPASLSTGTNQFTAGDDGIDLDASTTYLFVIEVTAGRNGNINFSATSSDDEDAGAAAGWSIANGGLWKGWDSSSWVASDNSREIVVVGYAKGGVTDPTVTIAGGAAVTEGTAAAFTLTASSAPSADLTVNLTVAESADGDYVAAADEGSKTVTIGSGATTATYSVSTQADSTDEADGSVTVTVAAGTGYAVGTTASASVTVNDDDPSHAVTLSLNSAGTDNTYHQGDAIEITATFAESVTVDTADGTPRIPFTLGTATKHATYAGGSPGTSQVFSYTVAGGDADTDGIAVAADALELNGGTINLTADGSTAAALDHAAVAASASHKVDGDAASSAPAAPSMPTVTKATATSVTVSWTAPADNGSAITDYDVQYRRVNHVDGDGEWMDHSHTGTGTTATVTGLVQGASYQARVRATSGVGTGGWSDAGAGHTGPALFESAVTSTSGVSVFVAFTKTITNVGAADSYTVFVDTQSSTPNFVLPLGGNALYLNIPYNQPRRGDVVTVSYSKPTSGAQLTDADGEIIPSFSPQPVTNNVTSVQLSTTSPDEDGTYYNGEEIEFRATFDVSVTVDTADGTPRIPFTLGTATKHATYSSGSPGTALVFSYTVAGGDTDTDGIEWAANALELNGGTINLTSDGTMAAALDHPKGGPSASRRVNGRAASSDPRITIAGGSAVTEGTSAEFTLTAGSAPSADLTVNLSISEEGDFVAAGDEGDKTVTIASGSTTATYTVATQDDSIDETDNSVYATVKWGSNYRVGSILNDSASVTVQDDDDDGNNAPTVANAISDQTATVGTAFSFQFAANTFDDADGDTLSYTAAKSDDTALPGWLSFAAGTRTFSGTPAATDTGTVAVKVTASDGNGGSVSDTFDIVVSAPASVSLALNSAGTDNTYHSGDAIEITATFAESVTVDTTDGTPRIPFTLGTATKHATYASGSPRTELVFAYTVAGGDADTDGIEVAADVLELNGGTINLTADGSTAAALDHAAVAASTSHKVDGDAASSAPAAPSMPTVTKATATSVTVSWTAPADNGSAITDYDVQYRRVNHVDGDGEWTDHSHTGTGTTATVTGLVQGASYQARVRATSGVGTGGWSDAGAGHTGPALFESAATSVSGGGVKITFTKKIKFSTFGAAYPLVVNGVSRSPAIASASGGTVGIALLAADRLRHGDVITVSYEKPQNPPQTLDADNLAVASFSGQPVTNNVASVLLSLNSPGNDLTYGLGDAIEITATFAESVTVTGTPRIPFTLGTATKHATYSSGSPGKELVFSYTVASDDLDTDGIRVAADALELNGGTINLTSDSGTAAALDHHPVGSAGFKVDGTPPPSVTGVEVTSDPGGDLTYQGGDGIRFTVTFDRSVTVDRSGGTPRLPFTLGTATRHAAYASGSPGKELVFAYTVASGDEDTDGIAVAADALDENGGTIRSAGGLDADLDHTALTADVNHKVDGSGTQDTTAPTVSSATVNGSALTITFSEAMDTRDSAKPAAGAFAVKVNSTARTVSTVAVSGTTVSLSLSSAVSAGDTVTVSYTQPSEKALQDHVGANDVASFSDQAVSHVPTVSSVALTSDPGADLTYTGNEKIQATVTFSEAVTVDTTNGTPLLRLRLRSEHTQTNQLKTMSYASGTGTKALVFSYTVASQNDSGGQGVTVVADTLDANNGTIQSSGGVDADLTHSAVGPDTNHKVAPGTADTTAPTVSSATVSGSALTITFSEALDTRAVAKPAAGAFAVKVNSTARMVNTVAVSGTTVTLTLASAVSASDTVTVSYTKPSEKALQDFTAGNDVASFTDQSVSHVPTVSSVAITSDPGGDVTYQGSDVIQLTATFSEAVTVTGTPRIPFTLGSATKHANYTSGSTSTKLVFAYTVASGDEDTDGIAVAANALELNSGTIKSSGSVNANLAHTALTADANHKVDGSGTQDTTAPTVSSATVSGSALTITFSEALDTRAVAKPAAGAFAVKVNSTARMVNTVAVSGTTVTLTLASAVSASDTVTVSYTKPSEKALQDFTAGNDVASFTDQSVSHVPTVSSVAITSDPGGDVTYQGSDVIQLTATFSEAVTVTGTPRIPFTLGSATKHANYTSGSTSTKLVFAYTVASGDEDTDGIAVAANALELNSGTIKSSGSVNANLAHTALTADANHKVDGSGTQDTTAPTVSSATVNGTALTITFSETLDTRAVAKPAAGDFAVKVNSTARTVSTVAVSGSTVTLTLASAVSAGDTVTVSYTQPSEKALQDHVGANDVASFSDQAVTVVTTPTVSSVAITSDPGGDVTYQGSDVIQFTATFSEAVTVDTTDGTPRIPFTLGSATKHANYTSGSTSTKLVFAYTVASADEDTNGIAVAASALELNGGTIKSSGSVNANLAHTALSADANHKVDGSGTQDTTAPTVWSATVNGSALTITFSETLDTRAVAKPAASAFAVKVNSTARTVNAVAVSGTTVTLTLASAVSDGDTVTVSYTQPSEKALQDHVGANDVASFTDQSVSHVPTVSSVAITSDPGGDVTYQGSDVIQITATFSESVTVDTTDGTPRIAFTLGSATKHAAYASGSPGTALVFSYTVASADEDTNGIAVAASALELNGGTIKSSGSVNANLAHTALSADANHKVDGSGTRDTTAPTVSSATVSGSALTITFSETLDTRTTAKPAAGDFAVKVGGTARTVNAVAVTGSTVTLTLASAVSAGDTVTVSYTKPSEKALQDHVGANDVASFTDQAVTVVTTPTVSSVAITSDPGGDVTYQGSDVIQLTATFSEAVTVTGTPRIPFTLGSATKHANYTSGSTSTKLVFAYTVASADEDTNGIAVAASALELNGGTIKSSGSVNANLAHTALNADANHKVDGSGTRDTTAPTVSSATVSGSALTITFSETLDTRTTAKPAAGDFAVKVGGTARTVNAVAVTGSTVTLTLASAVSAGDTVTVSYTKPSEKALQDHVGANDVASFTDQAVTVVTTPTVSSVAITSDPGGDVTYQGSDVIQLTATFSEAVTVTGTPRIPFTLGSATKHANYTSGSTSTKLVFAYTVASADEDTNGIAVAASALELNGGTIKSSGSVNANLAHTALTADANHKVDGSGTQDTTAPTVSSATVNGTALTITFSETLDTRAVAKPAAGDFAVKVNSTARTVSTVAVSGSTVTLTLASAVSAGDTVTVSYTKPSEKALQDHVGANDVASFTDQAVSHVPTVSSVAITSDPGGDLTYQGSDVIQFTATFSEAVTVTGTPRIPFTLGSATKHANYTSGSTSTKLVFAYTVASGDEDTNGIAVAANALELNSGTIKSSGSVNADLNHTALSADTNHKVDGSGTQDTTAPTVSSATVNGSALTITFSETLDTRTTAKPAAGDFAVKVGGTARTVNAVAVSGSTVTLTLASAVSAGDTVTVSYTKPSEKALQDHVGANDVASFTDQAVSHVPTVSSVAITSDPGGDLTYQGSDAIQFTATFSESVTVTGTPRIPFTLGTATKQANYTSGSTSTKLMFAYTVASGDEDTNGIAVAANALELNSGTIKSAGSVNANLNHTALTADANHKVDGSGTQDTTAPTVSSATVNGTALTITFSETLDTRAVAKPAAGDFAVKVNSTARTVSTVAVSGSTVTLTLASAVSAGDTVTVSYRQPSEKALQDHVGANDVASFSDQAVTVVTTPTVSSVAITSDPGGDVTYQGSDVIQFTATFSEAVTVDTTDGTPRIPFTLGSATKHANYTSGSTSTKLVFAYTVASADEDTNGIAVAASALELNGGTIKSSGSVNANLAHTALSADANHKVDGSGTRDTTAPTVWSATVNGSALTITFSETLDTRAVAKPAASAFAVKVNSTARTVNAVAVSGTTVTLTLASAVSDGDTVTVSYTQPSEKALQDHVGANDVASFTDQSVSHVPTVSSVAITSDPGGDVTYQGSDVIQITATFSESVTVDTTDGTPRIAFTLGSATKHAAYASGSPGTALVFSYTVASADEDTNGIAVAASALELNGGTIKSSGSVNANLAHTALSADANHKVDGSGTRDTTAPTVSSATVSGSALTITFSETLDTRTTAKPAAGDFAVKVGGTARTVNAVAVTGSTVTLTLASAVSAGDTVTVSYTKPSEKALQDHVGANDVASFTDQAVTVVTTPTVSSVAITSDPGGDVTYQGSDVIQLTATFSEAVTVTGTPRIPFTLGSATKHANYTSGSTSTKLVFAYTVASADEDTNGIAVAASALELNGGTIKSSGSVNANLAHTALNADANHKVDGSGTRDTTAPTVSSATVSGSALTITFSETLDTRTTAKPAAGDFAVKVGGTARTVNAVAVTGSTVTLTLASAVSAGDTVTVSYTKPSEKALQDHVGANDVASFTDQAVTVVTTPTVSSVAITSDPGGDVTYQGSDVIQLTATFSEAVTVTGTPRIPFTLGSATKHANYTSGSTSTKLVFAYTVASADEDTNGIAVAASALELNGGTIKSSGSVNANLAHTALTADANHKVDGSGTQDTTAPTVSSATVNGTALTITFSETLDTRAVAKPAAGDFAVKVNSTARTVSTVAVSGSTVTLTLASAVSAGDTVTVSYTKPSEKALQDHVGANDVASFTDQAVSHVPTVSSVAITSDPGGDLTYQGSDVIQFTATFSEAVTVTGTPRIPFTLGTATKHANYTSGSTSTKLVFAYTVASGDEDTNGIAVAANALELNSGTIKSSGSVNANLAHTALTADANHKVDGSGTQDTTAPTVSSATVNGTALTITFSETLDTRAVAKPAASDFAVKVNSTARTVNTVAVSGTTVTLTLSSAVSAGDTVTVSYTQPSEKALQDHVGANDVASFSDQAVTVVTTPTVSSVAITSDPGGDVTYQGSDVIQLTATFSEAVTVTGTPRIPFTLGTATKQANYTSGSTSTKLVFAYTVASGDTDTDGIAVAANALELNGGTIKSSGSVNANLAHTALSADANHKVDGSGTQDTTAPTVSSATVNGSALTITFSETLDTRDVAKPATSDFAVKVNSTARTVNAVAVSGTTVSLSLSSAVSAGDTVTVSYTQPSEKALQDHVGANDVASFSDQAVSHVPTVSSVALTSDPGADLTYTGNEKIQATVTFSEAVTVDTTNGTPLLRLRLRSEHTQTNQLKTMSYASGTGTKALVFSYTVASQNDSGGQGVTVVADTLDANNGTIQSSGGVDADLTHSAVGPDTNHKVAPGTADTTAPTVSSATVSGSALTITFSEALDTRAVAKPAAGAFAVKVNSTARTVNTVAVSGTTVTLSLASAVSAGDTVTVSYTKPSEKALQDFTAGNDVASFTDQSVSVVAAPDAPAEPTVTKASDTSVTVSWAAPTDNGSAITDYDVQYRRVNHGAADADWTDRDHTGTATAATVTGLVKGASYEARVRATNGEGSGAWSDPGAGHTGPAAFESATTNAAGTVITITFPKNVTGGIDLSAWTVSVNGAGRTPSRAYPDGNIVGLRLSGAHTVRPGDVVTVGYTASGSANLRDADGLDVASFSAQPVTNAVSAAFLSATTTADGVTVILTFTADLQAPDPAPGSFTVTAGGTARTPSALAQEDDTLSLTLSSAILAGQTVTVSYAKPATGNKLLYDGGVEAASFSGKPVTNAVPPAVTGVAVTSDAGADLTYAEGETIEVTLTFSAVVSVDTSGGTPSMKFRLHESHPDSALKTMTWARGSGTPRLAFVYTVTDVNESSSAGIGVPAGTVDLNGGTITSAVGGVDATLAYTALSHDSNHQVDGPDATALDRAPALAVSAGAAPGSLSVSWTALGGATDYDLRYFAGSADPTNTADWVDEGEANGPPDPGASTSETITGLAANTAYRVQVRAQIGDGEAPWSASASATTASPAAAKIGLVRIVSKPTHDSDTTDTDKRHDTYVRGDRILVDVEFNEAVEVGGDRNVRLRLDVGTDDTTLTNSRRTAALEGVLNGGMTLRFAYTVQTGDCTATPPTGDCDQDGVWVQTEGAANTVLFTPGTATVTGAASGVAAALTLNGLPTAGEPRAKVDGGRTSVEGPSPSIVTVNGATLTVIFDENLKASVNTDELVFSLHVRGAAGIGADDRAHSQHPDAVSVSGATLTLTLDAAARAGETVTLTYTGTLLQDAGGNRAPMFRDLAVTNNTAGTAGPSPLSASVVGKTLRLVFDGALDGSSKPAGSAFLVEADDPHGDSRGIAGTGTAAIDDDTVTVRLAEAVRADELASVSYTKPDTAPLQGTASGNPAVASFDRFRIQTVYDGVPPALLGGTVSGTKAVLSFDERLDTGSVPAAGDFDVSVAGTDTTVSSVEIKGASVVLTLAATAAARAEVAVAYTPGTNLIRDLAGNPAAAFKRTWTAAATGTPALRSAVVDGARLALTYDLPLDPASVPGPEAFTLHWTPGLGEAPADRHEWNIGIAAVAVEGRTAVLHLKDPVFPCAPAFTVNYARPAASPLQGLDGTDADGLALRAVTNARADRCENGFSGGRVGSVILRGKRPFATDVEPRPAWFTVAASGGPVTVTGAAFSADDPYELKLALSREIGAGETVTVSYRRPRGERGLWDVDGNQFADVTDMPVANGPAAISAVAVVSDPGPDGAYTEGETVRTAVTFSVPVRVDTSAGTPTLALIADGRVLRAAYASGSGTARLVFGYRVQEEDGSLGAVRVAASGLKRNGGTIAGEDGTPAALGFGEAPGVTGVSVADEADGRWDTGDTVQVTLRFAEPVVVEGAPSVALSLGGVERRATYARGSGSEALAFGYTLTGEDGAHGSVQVMKDGLSVGDGGALLSAGGGLDAQLAHPSVARTLEPPAVLPTLSVADAQAPEGTVLVFPVNMSAASAEPVTVDYASADGTAVAGADYPAVAGTLTFAPGETAKTVEVAALADDEVEGEETVTLSLSNPQGATIAAGTATGTVADVAPGATALTAVFTGLPAEHDGKRLFSFELRFSEDFPGRLGYRLLRDEAFQVTNGQVRIAKRMAQGQNRRWEISVRPASYEDVVVTLPAGAVTTQAGRKLANTVVATVRGPALLSVADASAREGVDAEMAFEVTLSRAAAGVVTVDYRTVDGTASAGTDYVATAGTLTFAAGERSRTVAVPVLDDAHDEGTETFTLKLRNARGAWIVDGEATGTILNADPMPTAWLARFGRTVTEQVLDGVQARLEAPRAAGGHALVAGQPLGGGWDEEAAARPDDEALERWLAGTDEAPRTMTGQELLARSAFALTGAPAEEGAGSAALWGRGGWSRFDGREDDLTVDGDVLSAAVGADYAWGRWLGGTLLTHARGAGTYQGAAGGGEVESTLTGVFPYAGVDLSDRLSAWAVAGLGRGGLTLTPDAAQAFDTDLTLLLAALGARGRLVEPAGGSGFSLAIETDAFWVRTNSGAVPGLAAAEADATRLRLGLDGGYRFALAGGGTLEPAFEIGVRHDGGDADTGYGTDLGGRLMWTDPALGLAARVSARGLLTAGFERFRDVGLSGLLTWDPNPSSDRGPSVTVSQTLGGLASGGMHALLARPTLVGLAPAGDGGDDLESRRMELRADYGFAAFRDRFTATPEFRLVLSEHDREYGLGWRLALAESAPTAFELALQGTRREHATASTDPEYGLSLRVTARW